MSKIALSGNASGTGTLTIAAPNTDSDATINLPTVTGGEFIVSNASGNVGIGTSSPSALLTVQKDLNGNAEVTSINLDTGVSAAARLTATSDSAQATIVATSSTNNGSATGGRASTAAFFTGSSNTAGGIAILARNSAGIITMHTGGNTERARIDSSGNLLANQTSQGPANAYGFCFGASNTGGLDLSHPNGAASGILYARFNYNGSSIGSITQNGTTAVAYNTSSDYRLKEDIQPMTGALAKVAALKPCTYKWKSDGSDGEGFIAHELAEVVPQCVTGEKDAVDEEGNPVYQGIDTSFLVATLTAAIQELKASLDEVKLEFDAYKATHP